jgi:hypothetical protein
MLDGHNLVSPSRSDGEKALASRFAAGHSSIEVSFSAAEMATLDVRSGGSMFSTLF